MFLAVVYILMCLGLEKLRFDLLIFIGIALLEGSITSCNHKDD